MLGTFFIFGTKLQQLKFHIFSNKVESSIIWKLNRAGVFKYVLVFFHVCVYCIGICSSSENPNNLQP